MPRDRETAEGNKFNGAGAYTRAQGATHTHKDPRPKILRWIPESMICRILTPMSATAKIVDSKAASACI